MWTGKKDIKRRMTSNAAYFLVILNKRPNPPKISKKPETRIIKKGKGMNPGMNFK
jgi:hypothetical protein